MPSANIYPMIFAGKHVSTDRFALCACCNALHENAPDPGAGSPYCDRCTVAYLEFKLGLLVSACRYAVGKADEV